MAFERNILFTGSTSSTSAALSQTFFFLSGFRQVEMRHLPVEFQKMASEHTLYMLLMMADL
jgi:hypothetical protein